VLGVIDRMRHRCRVQADLRACVVDVDPAAVERAVANLIDNAVKWSAPDDPVHVTVADGRVTVTDCGPGIAEQDLPHIFERFYRAPAARGMPGAGLGLAIVGQVATAHHASVTVDTGPRGSSFVLAF
jgi:two-component system sensor histidine kinase MprB